MHRPFSYRALRHLPGIRDVLLGQTTAVIHTSTKCIKLHADSHNALLKLLDSFLVPICCSTNCKSLLEYNVVMDCAEAQTDPLWSAA